MDCVDCWIELCGMLISIPMFAIFHCIAKMDKVFLYTALVIHFVFLKNRQYDSENMSDLFSFFSIHSV